MLRRENFTQLKEAIEAYTSIDYYKIKSVLTVAIYYLIKSSCKAKPRLINLCGSLNCSFIMAYAMLTTFTSQRICRLLQVNLTLSN